MNEQEPAGKKIPLLDQMMRSFIKEKDEAFLEKFKGELFRRPGKPNGKPNGKPSEMPQAEAFSKKNGGGVPAPGAASPSLPSNENRKESRPLAPPALSTEAAVEKSLPPKGAILHLESGEIALFHRDVPGKQYQVVLVLNPDGTLSPEGIRLDGFEQIGLMPVEHLEQMLRALTWNRDHIIFHLSSFDYAHLIVRPRAETTPPQPAQTPTRTAEWPAPPPVQGKPPDAAGARAGAESAPPKMERGQRFRIPFDKNRAWEAVYWCDDAQGTVIAQKTRGQWSLLHLNLTRFKDTIQMLDKVSDEEAIEIEKAVRMA